MFQVYTQDLPIKYAPYMEKRARPPRETVHYETVATIHDRQGVPTRLTDVSLAGFSARCMAPVAEGDVIRIVLPIVGDVLATVRWALRGCFGARLETPLSSEAFSRALATMKTGRNDWAEPLPAASAPTTAAD